MPYRTWTGSCWCCSYQFASLSSNTWYDQNGYYRYYETCSCNFVLGCGKSGYRRNDYHTCGANYPTKYITSVTNRYGQTTITEMCSYCGYYWQYTY